MSAENQGVQGNPESCDHMVDVNDNSRDQIVEEVNLLEEVKKIEEVKIADENIEFTKNNLRFKATYSAQRDVTTIECKDSACNKWGVEITDDYSYGQDAKNMAKARFYYKCVPSELFGFLKKYHAVQSETYHFEFSECKNPDDIMVIKLIATLGDKKDNKDTVLRDIKIIELEPLDISKEQKQIEKLEEENNSLKNQIKDIQEDIDICTDTDEVKAIVALEIKKVETEMAALNTALTNRIVSTSKTLDDKIVALTNSVTNQNQIIATLKADIAKLTPPAVKT